jgi:hypothetical protein
VIALLDRYDIQNSIKKAERDRRSKSVFTAKMYEVIEGRVIPDWKKFIGQMIHWFQSIEGLLLFALDGRRLSGLPNCAIFRKTLTTVPTNDFLTTCKH